MFRTLMCCGAVLFLFSSCKKDKPKDPDQPIPDMVFADFNHLKPGNYWIYQLYMVDSNGNATATDQFDSVYAGPEQVINGKTYMVRMEPDASGNPDYIARYLRDSLQYTVTEKGAIECSSLDFNRDLGFYYFLQFEDTVAFVSWQMTAKNQTTTVAAGTFNTYTKTTFWHMREKYSRGGSVRKVIKRYNRDIGIVSENTYFYADSDIMPERRLVRYHVQ